MSEAVSPLSDVRRPRSISPVGWLHYTKSDPITEMHYVVERRRGTLAGIERPFSANQKWTATFLELLM